MKRLLQKTWVQTTIAAAFLGFALLTIIDPFASSIAGIIILILFVVVLARYWHQDWRDKMRERERRAQLRAPTSVNDPDLEDEFERKWRERRTGRRH